jgi:hypothetical protein
MCDALWFALLFVTKCSTVDYLGAGMAATTPGGAQPDTRVETWGGGCLPLAFLTGPFGICISP